MRYTFRPQALRDIDALFDYIVVENRNADYRIIDAIIDTCEMVADNPEIAPRARDIAIEGIRKVPIIGFHRYIIVYIAHADHIEIVRAGYGGRDWGNLI